MDNAAWEQKKREEMKRMINDGDTEGQMLILKEMMNAIDKPQNERFITQGLPPNQGHESHFHNMEVDDELFQPCPPKPDCPICFLPLPRAMLWKGKRHCSCCCLV